MEGEGGGCAGWAGLRGSYCGCPLPSNASMLVVVESCSLSVCAVTISLHLEHAHMYRLSMYAWLGDIGGWGWGGVDRSLFVTQHMR